MKREFKFENGDKVEESITGFTGVITGTAFYLTGCNQYLIIPKCKDTHIKSEGEWYDEGRLEMIESNVINSNTVTGDDKGVDKAAPNKG